MIHSLRVRSLPLLAGGVCVLRTLPQRRVHHSGLTYLDMSVRPEYASFSSRGRDLNWTTAPPTSFNSVQMCCESSWSLCTHLQTSVSVSSTIDETTR
jgi:hypothetical protein